MSWKGDCHEGVRDLMLRWLKTQLEELMAEHMDLQDVYFDCVSFECYSSVQTFALCTDVLNMLPAHTLPSKLNHYHRKHDIQMPSIYAPTPHFFIASSPISSAYFSASC
jgi:hypothetical protein